MSLSLFGDVSTGGTDELIAKVEIIRARAQKNPRSEASSVQPLVTRLPSWDDGTRCMSNELLRSALFNARNRNQTRRYFDKEEIAVIGGGVRIQYTGKELRQTDELVWLQLVHMARNVPLGSPIEFTAYSMARALRQPKSRPNQQHVERLLDSLRRMQASSLAIYSARLRRTLNLSMIPRFEWEDFATGERLSTWRAWIAPELVELFGDVHFTRLLWAQRLALPSGLATWMHGYFASHRNPFPVKLSTLQSGAGCITESPRKFRQLVAIALDELKDVGFLQHSEIQGEKVYVERR